MSEKREVVHNNVLKREFLPPSSYYIHSGLTTSDGLCSLLSFLPSPVNVNVQCPSARLLLLLRRSPGDESLDNTEYRHPK